MRNPVVLQNAAEDHFYFMKIQYFLLRHWR